MTNLTDLTADSVTTTTGTITTLGATTLTATTLNVGTQNIPAPTAQAIVADGAITIKHGVVTLAKTVEGALAVTLADPTATTDDYKRLTIVALQAQANTVTSASSFGGGGAGEDVATFSGAIGDSLSLIAYQGKWYVTGTHQVTLA